MRALGTCPAIRDKQSLPQRQTSSIHDSAMNKAAENTATSSEDARRQTQGQLTVVEQSGQTKAAPSGQPQKMTTGTPEQTKPAPNEQSEKMTAGAAQPAPSGTKPGESEEGC